MSLVSTCAVVIVGGAVSARNADAASLKVAYAHVLDDGTLDTGNSKNVVEMGGGNGLYCFKLTFEPQNAVATLADDPTAPNQGVGFIKVAVPPTPTFTCATISKPNAVEKLAMRQRLTQGARRADTHSTCIGQSSRDSG